MMLHQVQFGTILFEVCSWIFVLFFRYPAGVVFPVGCFELIGFTEFNQSLKKILLKSHQTIEFGLTFELVLS